ncbi:MAG: histidine phosphatase family protein, partial [Candidatus Eremiobacteraeota bacterium]|nr:histidine phosphatase family protein [Candidatus Eremiobacteraeota bacterium]
MLEVWWIRHGQSTWNEEGRWQGHADVPLTELGRQQARSLQARLAGIGFDQVFSSDLERASQTASLALPDRRVQLDP